MIGKAAALALICALICTVLSELGFKSKKILSVVTLMLVLSLLLDSVGEILVKLGSFARLAGVSDGAKAILKSVGVGYLGHITSTVCSELGEQSLSTAVSLVAKIEILLIVLPYFEKTVSLGLELLQ